MNNQLAFPMPMQVAAPPSDPPGIAVQVIVKELYDAGGDTWPDRFMTRPRKGDVVQSSQGRRLAILDVVHGVQNGGPILQVEIGVDRNDNTATGGGGGDLL